MVVLYYLVFGLLYVVSLLPLQVLYLFSDCIFFLLYYVFGYRKKVVMANLLQAFPGKTEAERKQIARRYYRHFTDNFIELLKLISADKEFIRKHFTGDFSVFNKIYADGKRCQFLLSHHFNWELACVGIPLYIQNLFLVVYMPVNNEIFERLMKYIRLRTGAALVSAKDMQRSMLKFRKEKYVLGLVADQNPGSPAHAYWVQFFGRLTPFVKAPESGAMKSNMPVVFGHFKKIKRGYYTSSYILAEENPASLQPGELTVRYVRFLEQIIKDDPETWLWSHRRWKHEWKPEYGEPIG
ncbi:MAG: lysophospholipid acyltransferase family protein [Bacteroidetes bacterium]|nr:lysophospholipid acyltransferase family protein [Bacteroidota bacterium]